MKRLKQIFSPLNKIFTYKLVKQNPRNSRNARNRRNGNFHNRQTQRCRYLLYNLPSLHYYVCKLAGTGFRNNKEAGAAESVVPVAKNEVMSAWTLTIIGSQAEDTFLGGGKNFNKKTALIPEDYDCSIKRNYDSIARSGPGNRSERWKRQHFQCPLKWKGLGYFGNAS